MKNLKKYINEKLVIGNNLDNVYIYFPKNINELIECIKDKIEQYGIGTKNKPLDLNDIDTSRIIDMNNLFNRNKHINKLLKKLSLNGHFDISDWDVSNVENMSGMFYGSGFSGDISNWDVSKVRNMSYMFVGSYFNGNISGWDVSNVKNMKWMFMNSVFNGDISNWDVSNVEDMNFMFYSCEKFNSDLSNWDIKNVKDMTRMFEYSALEKNPPKWYKDEV